MILIGWNHYQNIMVIISLQDLRRGVKCQSDAAATHRPSLCGVYSRAAFINTVEFRDYAPPHFVRASIGHKWGGGLYTVS